MDTSGPSPELLPLFLKLAGRPVLVVGAGVVATSKIASLIATGAHLTVVAPEISDTIRRSGVTLRERAFEDRDLDGQWLVISAAPPEVNRVVAEGAARRRIFINAVDDPSNGSAYFGGVMRREGVTIAISTDGRAPAIAGLLREGLEALLPADLDSWLTTSDALKREWRDARVPMEERRPALLRALNQLYADRRDEDVRGIVSIVGAGPGDPDLLTVRATQRLRDADVVFYDGLVPETVVAVAHRAERVSVARRAGPKTLTQDDVNAMLIDRARRGQRVVRLKSGDPFIFGRGGEEILALTQAGVACEVVPGLSAVSAAPAVAGIPLTHRGLASAFVVVSGHAPASYARLLASIAPDTATIVVLMGTGARGRVADDLQKAGWDAATPAAIVTNASRPDQHVWIGTLGTLEAGGPLGAAVSGADDDRATDDDPGLIVIGQVVSLATNPGTDTSRRAGRAAANG